MKTIERAVAVNKPAPLVWDYLSDFRSTNDWDPRTKESRRVSGDGGVGTVYKDISEFAGKEVELTYTVTDLTAGSSVTLVGKTEALTSTRHLHGGRLEQQRRGHLHREVSVPRRRQAGRSVNGTAAQEAR